MTYRSILLHFTFKSRRPSHVHNLNSSLRLKIYFLNSKVASNIKRNHFHIWIWGFGSQKSSPV